MARPDAPRRRLLQAALAAAGLPATARAASPKEKPPMYAWLPTECAPERFPMRLLQGTLVLPDGRRVALPGRRDVFNGWGALGSTHLVGDAVKPLPRWLELEWFSYTEDRFFQGRFELPEAAIAAHFAAGIAQDRQSGQPVPFERIIVGMAPAGMVAVWLAAAAEVVEVGAWRAGPAELPWSRVLDNPELTREAFIRKVLALRLGEDGLARLKQEGVPAALYPGYRRLYRWRPWVTGSGRALQTRLRSYNGENAHLTERGAAIPRDTRPVPAELELQWAPPGAATPLWARVRFDEAEVFAAFAKLSRGEADRQLALQLETSTSAVAVTLRDEKLVLPLEKARVEVFSQR